MPDENAVKAALRSQRPPEPRGADGGPQHRRTAVVAGPPEGDGVTHPPHLGPPGLRKPGGTGRRTPGGQQADWGA